VACHPDFELGPAISKHLFDHYRREHFGNIAGGAGLSVVYRHEPHPTTGVPLPIDLEEGETSAIVVLFDENFALSPTSTAWLQDIEQATDKPGMRSMVFPVAIDASLTRSGVNEQAVRWDLWSDVAEFAKKLQKLTTDLTYQFSRMLRLYLERLRRPLSEEEELQGYLQKVQIFLSHSKHDDDGERIARIVREALHDAQGFSSFFDVKDIPTGTRCDRVLLRSYAPVRSLLFTPTASRRGNGADERSLKPNDIASRLWWQTVFRTRMSAASPIWGTSP